jgi:hypothetical protein
VLHRFWSGPSAETAHAGERQRLRRSARVQRDERAANGDAGSGGLRPGRLVLLAIAVAEAYAMQQGTLLGSQSLKADLVQAG